MTLTELLNRRREWEIQTGQRARRAYIGAETEQEAAAQLLPPALDSYPGMKLTRYPKELEHTSCDYYVDLALGPDDARFEA